MEYTIQIILDEKVKKPYMLLSPDILNDNAIKLEVHTSKKDKLNFKNMDIYTFFDDYLDDFRLEFSYGKDILSSTSIIAIRTEINDSKTIDYNSIIEYIDNNKQLTEQGPVLINIGVYDYDEKNFDTIKQFEKHENVLFPMDNLSDMFSAKTIHKTMNIINKVVDKVNKYPGLSQLEKAMLSYDFIRTNMAKSLDNNSEEEKDFNEFVDNFVEPSYFYSTVYTEVLKRLDVKAITATGNFWDTEVRKFTIAYIDDPKYNVEGVYYFDIGLNSLQRTKKAMTDEFRPCIENEDPILDTLKIYDGFAKTKADMEQSGFLHFDCMFADFNRSYLDCLEQINTEERFRKMKGIIAMNLNNVSFFIDGENLITDMNMLDDEDSIAIIKDEAERYLELFGNDICAEDFLELLFNVRKVEYFDNKQIFKLSTDALREIVYNSRVTFEGSTLRDEIDMMEFNGEEDEMEIEQMIRDDVESNFEDFTTKHNVDKEIMKLKLKLKKLDEQNKKDKND